MRYADTYLKHKRQHSPMPVFQRKYKWGEDPDWRMERFLRAQGEFSAEASIAFDRQLARNRELKLLGVL